MQRQHCEPQLMRRWQQHLPALTIIVVAACSFDHGAPAAGNGSDAQGSNTMRDAPMKDSRVGSGDGSGSGSADAGSPVDLCMADQTACTTAGGSCMTGTCVIPVSTMSGATCPDAMPCRINCIGMNACKNHSVSC